MLFLIFIVGKIIGHNFLCTPAQFSVLRVLNRTTRLNVCSAQRFKSDWQNEDVQLWTWKVSRVSYIFIRAFWLVFQNQLIKFVSRQNRAAVKLYYYHLSIEKRYQISSDNWNLNRTMVNHSATLTKTYITQHFVLYRPFELDRNRQNRKYGQNFISKITNSFP